MFLLLIFVSTCTGKFGYSLPSISSCFCNSLYAQCGYTTISAKYNPKSDFIPHCQFVSQYAYSPQCKFSTLIAQHSVFSVCTNTRRYSNTNHHIYCTPPAERVYPYKRGWSFLEISKVYPTPLTRVYPYNRGQGQGYTLVNGVGYTFEVIILT